MACYDVTVDLTNQFLFISSPIPGARDAAVNDAESMHIILTSVFHSNLVLNQAAMPFYGHIPAGLA